MAPRIKEQAKGRIAFDGLPLERASGYPWDAEIATLPIAGGFMTEVEFFHRASRTLILTDLIENFELDKIGPIFLRLLTWIGGVTPPPNCCAPFNGCFNSRTARGIAGRKRPGLCGW